MSKISIITVNYNDAKGLEETIKSVARQTHTDFEYIVIDGNSTDESITLIKELETNITKWVCEADNGVYHAMNKGIKMASGEYLLFLNSGDTFYTETTLEEISSIIDGKADIYYGDIKFINNKKEFLQTYPKHLRFSYFMERSLPHPGSFIRKTLFDTCFYYNENYKIISDWEFFICAICKYGVSYKHLGLIVSKFDINGMSNNPKNKDLIEQERTKALQKHFSNLYEDMAELMEQRNLLGSRNLKMQLELENSRWGRRMSTIFLNAVSFCFRKNKT